MSLKPSSRLFVALKRKLCFVDPIYFSTSSIQCKVVLKNKFKKSSQDWLTRHMKDPYVKLAAIKSYRARSAFKIIEINDKHKIFRPGMTVVECGCAPGAWTQVIVPLINSDNSNPEKPEGLILSLDKLSFEPVKGAITFSCCDISSPNTNQLLKDHLRDKNVDIVVSDMAPNASGNKTMDHDCIIQLASLALKFSMENSTPGATFLCKIWDGFYTTSFRKKLESVFNKVIFVKPSSSRTDSAELFLLAKDFKGL